MSLLLLFNSGGSGEPEPEAESEVTGRLFLAWGNLADAAALSGGSWSTGLPLANLKTRKQARVARSQSVAPADSQFDVDLGASTVWRVLALVRHNFGLDAQYRVRTSSSSSFASTDYDSGWTAVWPAIFNTEDLDWESDNWWSGTYTESQRDGYNWTLIVRPPQYQTARYVRVEIDDPNNVASHVQAGRLFIANGWSPSRGTAFGMRFGWVDPSQVQTAYGGAESFNRKTRYRKTIFELRALPERETYAQALEMLRQAGIAGEVLLMLKDDDTLQALQRQYLGRFEQIDLVDHPYPDHQLVPFIHKELL